MRVCASPIRPRGRSTGACSDLARVPPPFTEDDRYPAAVAKFSGGKLLPCDIEGQSTSSGGQVGLDTLPPNNRLVIYELPTTWSRSSEVGGRDMGVGTFRDVTALIDANVEGQNFADLDVTQIGRSYLTEIAVNALEL